MDMNINIYLYKCDKFVLSSIVSKIILSTIEYKFLKWLYTCIYIFIYFFFVLLFVTYGRKLNPQKSGLKIKFPRFPWHFFSFQNTRALVNNILVYTFIKILYVCSQHLFIYKKIYTIIYLSCIKRPRLRDHEILILSRSSIRNK